MHETLAARIVDARHQTMLLATVAAIAVGCTGAVPGLFLLMSASFTAGLSHAPQGADRWLAMLPGTAVLAVTFVAILVIRATARSKRRRQITEVLRLLEHGTRLTGRVVQARRVSMTQLRVAVHVDGPVAPFSEMIETRLDEAAFIQRPVTVVHDPANPRSYVLLPDW